MTTTVLCLMGPTASGKTKLALELVQALALDIVSVDSAMVYRGMDIGTAKPSAAELAMAPHRLIDICDPATAYSAGQFYQDAKREIDAIHQAQRTPLLVGGTMLYFHVLQQGFADLPDADAAVRAKLQQQDLSTLYQQLKDIDPLAAKQIHANDAQRIQRALEVFYTTGQTLSDYHAAQQTTTPYRFINIVLAPEKREHLHQLIEQRFDLMLQQGFINEVKTLYQRDDLTADLPAMRTVGYRQAWRYLTGEYDEKTMRQKAIIATRQLAKRQLTWLRSWPQATWFNSQDQQLLSAVCATLKQQTL